MKWIDKIPLLMLVVGALLLGLAPFTPEPHLLEKLRMLSNAKLSSAVDVFDLLLHGSLPILLIVKLLRLGWLHRRASVK